MNRNSVLQKIFEPERRSGAFRLNSTTARTVCAVLVSMTFNLLDRDI
jgi:hypothetical protein